jgi:hypothetical protein
MYNPEFAGTLTEQTTAKRHALRKQADLADFQKTTVHGSC